MEPHGKARAFTPKRQRYGTQAWYLFLPAYAEALSPSTSTGYPLTGF